MLEKYFFEILVALIFTISLLGTLIFFLAKKIQKESGVLKEGIKKKKKKEKYILESLDIICKAILQEQCEIAEGSIRVRMLLENSKMLDSNKREYALFFNMYEELKDFKTNEKRNELSKQERMNEDIKRFRIEEKYQVSFLSTIKVLHEDVKELL